MPVGPFHGVVISFPNGVIQFIPPLLDLFSFSYKVHISPALGQARIVIIAGRILSISWTSKYLMGIFVRRKSGIREAGATTAQPQGHSPPCDRSDRSRLASHCQPHASCMSDRSSVSRSGILIGQKCSIAVLPHLSRLQPALTLQHEKGKES
ncbi:hypothetical protein BDV32DRAFT_27126 [Aspergillus pseudonomiae]|uniref:Uncharacterized protein n=1 Tax=Aspergillus pseudonomiae TaxID=1506151 RepID=A0A5N7CS78_9EURO|nr:uncharacterized protein BDV37DRAFT_266629 [Aspergillus pseudonomiae]KAB8253786.1 hypothetical protein BDV32DRAFT_27126 [Aspergillus pseudonomiae]KAE8397090.1 hypothetical protein BDV37DRAFT_266629 [Aspergillus pseudonomiae]